MATSPLMCALLILYSLCFEFVLTSKSSTIITTTRFLNDSETIVSGNAHFKLGFFSPTNSTNRYVGIWYNIKDFDPEEVVWVANRNNPLNDSSGVLKISEDGNLQLFDGRYMILWSSNVSHQTNNTLVAELRDTGNLVLQSTPSGEIIWQSFEHLTNSLLPQTRISIKVSKINRSLNQDEYSILQSWKNASNPSNGRFRVGMIRLPITEFVTRKGDIIYWRSGPWNGSKFLGAPYLSAEDLRIVYNEHEAKLNVSFSAAKESLLQHFTLNHDGNVVLKVWDNDNRKWKQSWQSMKSECDEFGKCGPFGSCNPKGSPICHCLHGFEPKNEDEWREGNWTNGCVRRSKLLCGVTGSKEDRFLKLNHMKTPSNFPFYPGHDQDACRMKCLEKCQCVAYAHSAGIGCMMWPDVIDIQVFYADGVDLFIRLSHSELDETNNADTIIIAVKATIVGTIFLVLLAFCFSSRICPQHAAVKKSTNKGRQYVDAEVDLPECKVFNFKELEAATMNFSEVNKLGEGGFGPVYKGILENGQEIAVKRLSRASGQGLQEFMNEVRVISELQHKNLVRLLGCCAVRDEKLLIYELMPNKSLDAILFDSNHQKQLDWKKRFNIINGICRGLLYLHRDSRLKIIHRDLKASNILLDNELNSKISDFGMARIFETAQDQGSTLRVVGTYGYMSPEYAMEGRFSEKSDVFSLGVLLLEIISGRKNSSFLNYESFGLIAYAWKLWNENDILKLIDPTIPEPSFLGEIMKCIQLGLLCMQEFPEDRPTVSALVSMLDNLKDTAKLPLPTQPSFIQRKAISFVEVLHDLQSHPEHGSMNHASLPTFSDR